MDNGPVQVIPYLSFNGQCRAAFQFYERALGGKTTFIMSYGESPMRDQTPPDQHDRIMHASFEADGFQFAGADAPPTYFRQPQGFCVSINVTDPGEADRVFNALAENGQVNMPIGETFWAKRFGMLIDQFGTPWMVNCSKPM